MKTGTLVVRTMRAKKTGRVFKYEVYEASVGGLFVARLIEKFGTPVTATWGDPCDNETDAMKSAFHVHADPLIAARKKNEEYYRSGGY